MIRTKLEYITTKNNYDKEDNEKYGRYAEFTFAGNNKEVEDYINKFENFLFSKGYRTMGCPSDDELTENNRIYVDDILVKNQEEFESVKEIYKEFKKVIKISR
jgi:hypothetical protein